MDQQQELDEPYLELIDKWQGDNACLWEYSVSLSRLVIRITSTNRDGNLHIICGDCEYICGPVRWDVSSIQINRHMIADRSYVLPNHFYVLRNEDSNFEARFGAFGAEENVEPVF